MLLRLAEYAFIISGTEEYSEKDLRILDKKIVNLLVSMKNSLSVDANYSKEMLWHFVKFHLTTHTTYWIRRFGHCGQFDAATLERLHKLVSVITFLQRCTTHINICNTFVFPTLYNDISTCIGKGCVRPDK